MRRMLADDYASRNSKKDFTDDYNYVRNSLQKKTYVVTLEKKNSEVTEGYADPKVRKSTIFFSSCLLGVCMLEIKCNLNGNIKVACLDSLCVYLLASGYGSTLMTYMKHICNTK